MRRYQDFLPARRERGSELAPRSSDDLMNPSMFFNMSPWQMMRRMQEDMDQVFGQLFGSSGGPLAAAGQQTGLQVWSPSVDMSENDKEWTIEAELPGVREEDVQITVQDHHLILRAEMRQEEEAPAGQGQESQTQGGQRQSGQAQGGQAQANQAQGSQTQGGQQQGGGREAAGPVPGQAPQRRYFHRERRYGYFERVFPLPENADEDQIRCEFRNGVLTVHIPKAQPAQQQGRRIPVVAGAQPERGNGRTENKETAMAGAKGGEAGTAEQNPHAGQQARSNQDQASKDQAKG